MAAKKKPTPTAKPTVEEILNRDLPEAALKVMPHKQGMTAISPIYVTDRMNEAFGHRAGGVNHPVDQWPHRAVWRERQP